MELVSAPVISSPRQAVGIDIANESFEAAYGCAVPQGAPKLSKSRSFANTASGFEALITWLAAEVAEPSTYLFVMEATGVYYESLARWLVEKGYRVSVLLPNTVMAFARSFNIKTKSDAVDSRTLAHMGCERQLDPWQPAPASLKALKQLTRLRQRLVNQRSMTMNHLHASKKEAPVSETVIEYQQALIEFLNNQIKELEKRIQALTESDPTLKQSTQSLLSIPSIGMTTATTLLAETQNFRLFRNQAQLVSYAGYDVIKRQSGTSINHQEKISKKGNKHIRKALFFPSIIVSKYIPDFGRLYHRVNEKQAKTKMKGAVALQRKLLILAYQLVKNNALYDPLKHL